MDKIAYTTSENKILRFNWYLLDWCNYDCTYCSAKKAINKEFNNFESVSDSYKTTIARLSLIKEPFEVCVTGGEPTLHPHLEDILDGLQKLCDTGYLKHLYFFTNLSRSLDYLLGIKKSFPSLVMHASYHPEFYSNSFVEKCIKLDCEVYVSMSPDEKWWDQTENVIKQLHDNNIDYNLNILQPVDNWQAIYTEKFWNRFSKYEVEDYVEYINVVWDSGKKEKLSTKSINENQLNMFKGYYCTPGSFRIELNGDIYNVCTNEKAPININNITNKQVECPRTRCDGGLLFYPKQHPNSLI